MAAFLPVSAETTAYVRGGRACTLQSKHVIFATAHWHSLQNYDSAAEKQTIYSACIAAFIQQDRVRIQVWMATNDSAWFAYIQLVSQNSVECTNWKHRLCGCTWCCHEKTCLKCFCVTGLPCAKKKKVNAKATTKTVKHRGQLCLQPIDSRVVYHCQGS